MEPRAGSRREARMTSKFRNGSTLLLDLSMGDEAPPTAATPPAATPQFVYSAEDVARHMAEHGLTRKQLLVSMIEPASQFARPPISDFKVGAVGMARSGAVYVGVNVEFARMPLHNSIHAEQFLVANLKHHEEGDVEMIAVNAAPCGHCRQFLAELACSDTVQIVFGSSSTAPDPASGAGAPAGIATGTATGAVAAAGAATVTAAGTDTDQYSLADLLPQRFRPQDLLGESPPPLLLQPQNNAVCWGSAAGSVLSERSGDAHFLAAAEAALDEAHMAYCPYSQCPAGVAIITASGSVYSGGYIESCAYNPSLPPLQAAIVDAVVDHMPCFTQVKEVVLVERLGAAVQHERNVRHMLGDIAPDATLTVLHAESA